MRNKEGGAFREINEKFVCSVRTSVKPANRVSRHIHGMASVMMSSVLPLCPAMAAEKEEDEEEVK